MREYWETPQSRAHAPPRPSIPRRPALCSAVRRAEHVYQLHVPSASQRFIALQRGHPARNSARTSFVPQPLPYPPQAATVAAVHRVSQAERSAGQREWGGAGRGHECAIWSMNNNALISPYRANAPTRHCVRGVSQVRSVRPGRTVTRRGTPSTVRPGLASTQVASFLLAAASTARAFRAA